MDKNAANLHNADAALEAEIARLREDEHVKLAALGVTMANLDEMLCDNGGDT